MPKSVVAERHYRALDTRADTLHLSAVKNASSNTGRRRTAQPAAGPSRSGAAAPSAHLPLGNAVAVGPTASPYAYR